MKKILSTAIAATFVLASASAASALTYEQFRSGYEIGGAEIQTTAGTRNQTRPTPRVIIQSEPDYDHSDPRNN